MDYRDWRYNKISQITQKGHWLSLIIGQIQKLWSFKVWVAYNLKIFTRLWTWVHCLVEGVRKKGDFGEEAGDRGSWGKIQVIALSNVCLDTTWRNYLNKIVIYVSEVCLLSDFSVLLYRWRKTLPLGFIVEMKKN